MGGITASDRRPFLAEFDRHLNRVADITQRAVRRQGEK